MKKTNQSATGTSFHSCTITATVNELTAILGEPITGSIEDKVTHEWEMETEQGDIFTVYDWKEYREIEPDEKINWHIGGKSAGVTIQAQAELITALTTQIEQAITPLQVEGFAPEQVQHNLVLFNRELFKMVIDLKNCIKRLTSDDALTQYDKDTEAQWEGEAHELLSRIDPNYYKNANE